MLVQCRMRVIRLNFHEFFKASTGNLCVREFQNFRNVIPTIRRYYCDERKQSPQAQLIPIGERRVKRQTGIYGEEELLRRWMSTMKSFSICSLDSLFD